MMKVEMLDIKLSGHGDKYEQAGEGTVSDPGNWRAYMH